MPRAFLIKKRGERGDIVAVSPIIDSHPSPVYAESPPHSDTSEMDDMDKTDPSNGECAKHCEISSPAESDQSFSSEVRDSGSKTPLWRIAPRDRSRTPSLSGSERVESPPAPAQNTKEVYDAGEKEAIFLLDIYIYIYIYIYI